MVHWVEQSAGLFIESRFCREGMRMKCDRTHLHICLLGENIKHIEACSDDLCISIYVGIESDMGVQTETHINKQQCTKHKANKYV